MSHFTCTSRCSSESWCSLKVEQQALCWSMPCWCFNPSNPYRQKDRRTELVKLSQSSEKWEHSQRDTFKRFLYGMRIQYNHLISYLYKYQVYPSHYLCRYLITCLRWFHEKFPAFSLVKDKSRAKFPIGSETNGKMAFFNHFSRVMLLSFMHQWSQRRYHMQILPTIQEENDWMM